MIENYQQIQDYIVKIRRELLRFQNWYNLPQTLQLQKGISERGPL